MTLHRTPIHHQALELIVQERILWCRGKAASGGWFTYRDGQLADQAMLVALWELLRERLIHKQGPGVFLTDAGHARLSEWGGDPTVRDGSRPVVMRGVAVAVAVGVLLFAGFAFGVEAYFRVAMRLEQKREKERA